MASKRSIFDDALSRFKNRLTTAEEQRFQSLISLDDLKRDILALQKSQEDKMESMGLRRIGRFFEGMEGLGKIIDVFLNTSGTLAFVWGPIKFLLQTASTYAASFETLLTAYESIGEHMPLLHKYEGLLCDDTYLRDILGGIYSSIMEFHSKALRFFNRPAWRQVFKSMWKDFESTFKSIIDDLERQCDLLDRLAGAQHMVQSQRDSQSLRELHAEHATHFEQYKLDRDNRQRALERDERDRARNHREEVLKWVSSATMSDLHEEYCRKRQICPGSGRWVLLKDKLEGWKDAEIPTNSVLWLYGIPGAGKTVLSSLIIEECEKMTGFKTSYFYCREADETTATCKGVLRGLIAQMIRHDEALVPYCHDQMKTSGDSTLVTEELAKKLLKLFCETIPKQYIIIDGLDECLPATRQNLVKIITGIVKTCDQAPHLGKPRLLIVSQKLGDIEKSLAEANSMELRREDNRADICQFVHKRAEELKSKFDLKLEFADQIKEFTLEYAHGMFLFATLVMENLKMCATFEEFTEEMEKSVFPRKIEDAYNRILNRIKTHLPLEKWERTRRLLGWIVAAKRSLKLYELQAIISMNLEEGVMEYEHKMLRAHITECCGALVQMVGDSRVELVHHTARKFIINNEGVNELSTQCEMTILCLQYLTFDCFGLDVSDEEAKKYISDGALSFQDYAVSRWFHHLQTTIEKCGDFLIGDVAGKTPRDLRRALDDFASIFGDNFRLNEEADKKWLQQAEEDCKSFKNPDLKHYLVELWAHVCKHQQNSDAKTLDKIGIPDLASAVTRNRKLMERMRIEEGPKQQYEAFYGRNYFKCERLTCPYFHEGFENGKDRDKHTRRHDRPFQCVIETCDQSTFGFSSNKQLEKHMRSYHPETCDLATLPVQFALLNQRKIEGTKWRCETCGKNFTRKINLKGHMDSHNGNKPHECPECGRGFTRKNDMVRHQKIHSKYHGT